MSERIVTLNFGVTEHVYRELVKAKLDSGSKTWPEFMAKIAAGEIDVWVEFVKINGKPAEDGNVEFYLGDYLYRWDGQTSMHIGMRDGGGQSLQAKRLRFNHARD